MPTRCFRYKVGKTRTWHDATAGGCFDSNGPNGEPHARATQFLAHYSPAFVMNQNLQNMVQIYTTTKHVAPNAHYLNVVDFDGNDAGIPFGARRTRSR
jgi:hypothetical protein